MRFALIFPLTVGLLTLAACTPNNSETESGASGSVQKPDVLQAASSAVTSASSAPVTSASAPAASAAPTVRPAAPLAAASPPAATPPVTSTAVYIARLRTLPEAGATIDVLTAGKLAIVAGCLVLQTAEGPALAVLTPAARFDPATGTLTQGGLRVTLGQPVAVTAVPRPVSDFGFLTKEPPSSCPKLVISMASLQRR